MSGYQRTGLSHPDCRIPSDGGRCETCRATADMPCGRWLSRASECEKACRGIPAPQTAMDAAREALSYAMRSSAAALTPEATAKCRRAIFLLTPEDR